MCVQLIKSWPLTIAPWHDMAKLKAKEHKNNLDVHKAWKNSKSHEDRAYLRFFPSRHPKKVKETHSMIPEWQSQLHEKIGHDVWPWWQNCLVFFYPIKWQKIDWPFAESAKKAYRSNASLFNPRKHENIHDCHQCTCTLVKDKKWQGRLEAKKLGFVRFLQCSEISRAFFPPFRKSWKSWNVLKVSKVLKVWKVLKRKKMFHSRSWTELLSVLFVFLKHFCQIFRPDMEKVWLKLGSFSGNFCLFGSFGLSLRIKLPVFTLQSLFVLRAKKPKSHPARLSSPARLLDFCSTLQAYPGQ